MNIQAEWESFCAFESDSVMRLEGTACTHSNRSMATRSSDADTRPRILNSASCVWILILIVLLLAHKDKKRQRHPITAGNLAQRGHDERCGDLGQSHGFGVRDGGVDRRRSWIGHLDQSIPVEEENRNVATSDDERSHPAILGGLPSAYQQKEVS